MLLLLGGLAAALVVVWPRRYAAAPDLPEQQRQAFAAMRQFKARALTASLALFGLGLAAGVGGKLSHAEARRAQRNCDKSV